MNIELGIKIGAFVISLLVFIKGVYEYTKAQRWKKTEFVSKEIKEFFNDFDTKRALILLDWNSNHLDLKPNEIEGKINFQFDDNLLFSSLQTHKKKSDFTNEEVVIKGIFDNFFDRLTMFDNYIETGLINVNDLKPYLIYWIKILADNQNGRKNKETKAQIWNYINEYGYENVKSLFNRFGYNSF